MYSLTLTENDIQTIAWAGDRYCWSDALSGLVAGENQIAEHEAWDITGAFEADMAGGHSPFCCLAQGELMDKLKMFWDEVI